MVDFFIGIFIATLITAIFTTRLYRLLLWYAANSVALGLAAVSMGADRAMIITGYLTIFLKGLILPYILKIISKKFHLSRQISPNIQIQYAILLAPAILVFTFYLAEPIVKMVGIHQNYISLSLSAIFLSLLLMLEHKHVAPKIVGFLMMENALFLLGTTATGGMPMLIELGIFFDLLIAVVVINLLFEVHHA